MLKGNSIVFLVIAAALGILLLLIQLLTQSPFSDGLGVSQPRSVEPPKLIPDVEVDEIQSVRFDNRERVLSFDRNGDGDYTIVLEDGELPARADRVRAFLESLLALDRSSPVTSDPRQHEELGVGDGSGFARGHDYSVRLTDDTGTVRDIWVGLLDDSSRALVRLANEDTVYRVQDTVSFYIEQGPVFWAELRVFAGRVSLSDVEYVRIERLSEGEVIQDRRLYKDERTRFQLLDSNGVPEDGQSYPANERAVRRILSLEAAGFLRNHIDPVSWRIVLRPDHGGEIVVNIGTRTGNAYPAELVDEHNTLGMVSRPTLALRADLFDAVLDLLFTEVQ